MSSIKWIKINVDMFDDEKIKIIQSMPEGDSLLVVWIKLITLAGKTNDSGYIYISENMPYTEEMLSIIMNKPITIIRLAIETFTKLQMIEIDEKGIYLVNFEKHQSIDKLEQIREQTRLRVAKHRAKLKEKNDVTLHVTQSNAVDKDIDIDIDKDIDIDNNTLIDIKVYNNFAEKKQCDCISKSTKERCTRRSTYNINGKNYCNQHSRNVIPDFNVKVKKFTKPTIEEISTYCKERNNGINAEAFYDFYESKGWVVGKNSPMKDWRACIRTWEKRTQDTSTKTKTELQRERQQKIMEDWVKGG